MPLEELRKQLSEIDKKLLDLFEKRMQLSKEIGDLKAKNSILVEDLGTEDQKLTILKSLAQTKNIHPDFIEKLWKLIFKESKRVQHKHS